ncbi:MAG: formylglycine-generating enzyme family protein [Anaerolineaceae bacterium]|nr:formylglycine-generating enzyme family protein [Anaerolineaceae bacterium]
MTPDQTPKYPFVTKVSIILSIFLITLIIFVTSNSIFHFNDIKLPDFSYRAMEPVDIRVLISAVDGMEMVYVPAGPFLMGSKEEDKDAYNNEKPQHEVVLDAFWIDRTEVTNSQYTLCVNAGICEPPTAFGVIRYDSITRDSYYDDPSFANYPVIHIDWYAARIYCEWTGRRLPTEAEWEKAARGTDGRRYPWGNKNVAGNLVNLADRNTAWSYSFKLSNDGYEDTSPVGNYPGGASPYGAYDMAGNVWEWVADLFDEDYYMVSPSRNPTGAEAGDNYVLRGGSFRNSNWGIRSSLRSYLFPAFAYGYIGFRCAMSE